MEMFGTMMVKGGPQMVQITGAQMMITPPVMALVGIIQSGITGMDRIPIGTKSHGTPLVMVMNGRIPPMNFGEPQGIVELA